MPIRLLAIAAIPWLLTAAPAEELGWQAKGTHGVVVAGRAGSAEAGLEILKPGGNAADAAAATLQMICNHLDFGRPADVLVTTPRYTTLHFTGSFNQPPPALGELMISPEMGTNVITGLKTLGHVIKLQTPPSWRTVISFDPKTGLMHGAGGTPSG